jgi:hypothetical protein
MEFLHSQTAPIGALGLADAEMVPNAFMSYTEFRLVLWDMQRSTRTATGGEIRLVCDLWQFGWPFVSLQSQSCLRFSYSSTTANGYVHGNGPIWWREGIPVAGVPIPVRPIWPGFLINTLFYAAIAAAARAAHIAHRSRKRRRNNQCPSCGYSLLGLTAPGVCPECGSGVNSIAPAMSALST